MKTNSRPIEYFIYARKSSEGEDRQVQSIERQLEEIKQIQKLKKLRVVGAYSESRSAMVPNNRPAFDEMVKKIKKGNANGILCWHLNRISRNSLESGIIQQLLDDGLIQSIQTKDKEYLPTDNSIIFSVESGMSSQYSKDLSKAVKSGLEKKLISGIAPISAPLGYLNTKLQERGANYIIKDPERFAVMRKAWDLILTGLYTPPQVLEILTNEIGLRTRKTKRKGDKPLSRSTIYRIFNDPFYAGLFLYNGRTYKGLHEPMITLDEFDRVQLLLGKYGRPRPKHHFFTYTGIMKCGECGSSITACEKQKIIKSTGKLKTYILYHCTRRKKGAETCTQRNCIPLDDLEEMISLEMSKYTICELSKDWAIDMIHEDRKNISESEQKIYDSQLLELSKLEKEIKNLFQMRLNDSITDLEYQNERNTREAKILRLKRKIEEAETGSHRLINSLEERFRHVAQIHDRFNKADPITKKAIFLSLGWNYTVKDKELFITNHLWLDPIQKRKDSIESITRPLELDKGLMDQRGKEAFNLLRPELRALVDEVRTEVEKESH